MLIYSRICTQRKSGTSISLLILSTGTPCPFLEPPVLKISLAHVLTGTT